APGVPLTVIFCVGGAVPFCNCVKPSVAGVAESVPAPTSNVTFTVAGLPDVNEDAEVIVIVPLYCLAVRPCAFTVTLSVAGVACVAIAEGGVTVSQLPPSVVETVVVKMMSEPLVETAMVLAAGCAAPSVCEKLSDVGVTV